MSNNKDKKKSSYNNFANIFINYVSNVDSLMLYVQNIAPAAIELDKANLKRMEKCSSIIRNSINKRKGKKKNIIELTSKDFNIINKSLKGPLRLSSSKNKLLYNGAFILLISYFDYLFSDILHIYYKLYPQILSKEEQSIKLEELKSCSDLEEAIDLIIAREIEKFAYRSFNEKFNYLEEKLQLDCFRSLINWNLILEGVEKRHLIVHNNSKINKKYIRIINSIYKDKEKKELKISKEIIINNDFFSKVLDELLLSGIIIIQNAWRKLFKGEIEKANSMLVDKIYDFLVEEKWYLAEKLCRYGIECDTNNSLVKTVLLINYCQTLKWQNKTTLLKDKLKGIDTSMLDMSFIVAIDALKSDEESFYKHLKEAIILKKISKNDIFEWPLFREFRMNNNYARRVGAIYGNIKKKRIRKKLS